jgi:hypothetical protein
VTLPGYQVSQKLREFQELTIQRHLANAGMEGSQSLQDLVDEAGVSQEEIAVVAKTVGGDAATVDQLLKDKFLDQKKPSMITPQINLPNSIKEAKQLTILTDPRWGQMFLPTYSQFKTILETEDWQSVEDTEKLVRQYLEDPEINAYVWLHLAHQYPAQLERVLQIVLERPEFSLEQGLDSLLQEYGKPLNPDLPDIASVPLHLHTLFQEALLEVDKPKAKNKGKQKAAMGFQA